MTPEKLQQYFIEYLETLNPNDDEEYCIAEQDLASQGIEPFLLWLKDNNKWQ